MFFLKKVPVECSSRPLERNFENLPKLFAEIQIVFKMIECKENFPAKISSGHVESSFNNPAE